MRYLMLVKGDQLTEAGILPDKKLFTDMTKFNKELADAGALIALDGLRPSSEGVRVSFNDGKTSESDGPFPNPTELVAGFWIIKVDSKEEAVDWAKRVPFQDGMIELRLIQEISDFPEEIRQAIGEDESALKTRLESE